MRRRLSPLAVIMAVLLLLLPTLATAQDDAPLVSLEISGSPLVVGSGGRIAATVDLAQPAKLRLRVVDFDGRTVRQSFEGQRRAGTFRSGWSGRDADGERVPAGPYRLVATATADGVTERAEAWVTVADRAVYAKRPGSITILVDPGHGGDYDLSLIHI